MHVSETRHTCLKRKIQSKRNEPKTKQTTATKVNWMSAFRTENRRDEKVQDERLLRVMRHSKTMCQISAKVGEPPFFFFFFFFSFSLSPKLEQTNVPNKIKERNYIQPQPAAFAPVVYADRDNWLVTCYSALWFRAGSPQWNSFCSISCIPYLLTCNSLIRFRTQLRKWFRSNM